MTTLWSCTETATLNQHKYDVWLICLSTET